MLCTFVSLKSQQHGSMAAWQHESDVRLMMFVSHVRESDGSVTPAV